MLARIVIVDEQPFAMVEREGFKDFVSTLQPLYKHASRVTVARNCMKLYASEKVNLQRLLSGMKSRVALTTDLWTSIQNQSYMYLTAHFIDDDWKLHKLILNFVVMPSHKGNDIGKMVEQCILSREIKYHVSTLTVDNTSSNDVVVSYLQNKLKSLIILDGEFFHVRCPAHILNLIMRDGFTDIDKSIVSIRGAVKWNSTYLILQSALKFRQTFLRLEDDELPRGSQESLYVTADSYFQEIVDPPSKLRYVQYCYVLIYNNPEIVTSMVKHIKPTLDCLFAFYEKSPSSLCDDDLMVDDGDKSDSCDDVVAHVSILDPSKIRKMWNKHNKLEYDVESKSEYERNLDEKCEEDIQEFDLLNWWKGKRIIYKVHSMIAKGILAIPITTIGTELTFNTFGCVLDQFHSLPNVSHVEALICTQDWLRRSSSLITLEEYLKDVERYEQDLTS